VTSVKSALPIETNAQAKLFSAVSANEDFAKHDSSSQCTVVRASGGRRSDDHFSVHIRHRECKAAGTAGVLLVPTGVPVLSSDFRYSSGRFMA
jgi:hypothetical protein